MIRLTDEEIPKDTTPPEGLDPKKLKIFQCGYDWGARAGAEAQLKKVAEWLDGVCEEHPEWEFGYKKVARSDCPYCWQALLEEVV